MTLSDICLVILSGEFITKFDKKQQTVFETLTGTLQEIFDLNMEVYAETPQNDIHDFVGTFKASSKKSFFGVYT